MIHLRSRGDTGICGNMDELGNCTVREIAPGIDRKRAYAKSKKIVSNIET